MREGKLLGGALANGGLSDAPAVVIGVDELPDLELVSVGLVCSCRGLQEGDEVILPSHTMTASPSAVIANKGIPILVDCNEEGMINPDLIEEKITQKTKYIMPVQLNGRTCKMEKIISLAEKYHHL